MLGYFPRRSVITLGATALALLALAMVLLSSEAGAVSGDTDADRVFGQGVSFTSNTPK